MKPRAVIRFRRAMSFPRFAMSEGETWGFLVYSGMAKVLDDIKTAERFEFAGGQCLSKDVDVIYEGTDSIAYAAAAGHIRPSSVEQLKALRLRQH